MRRSDDDTFWSQVEDALNAEDVDVLTMSLLDDICNETSLFKLKRVKLVLADSPLAKHPGLSNALNRQIERLQAESED